MLIETSNNQPSMEQSKLANQPSETTIQTQRNLGDQGKAAVGRYKL